MSSKTEGLHGGSSTHLKGSEAVSEAAVQHGRKYSNLTGKQIAGIVLLILGALAVVAASLLAAGRFGGAPMPFIAGGLIVVSIPMFLVAAYLLVKKPDPDAIKVTGTPLVTGTPVKTK